ncbi:MAG TPA: mandelate racemase/muconate lactonizing enzyme family protein [Bryobacteraceae bacterium]
MNRRSFFQKSLHTSVQAMAGGTALGLAAQEPAHAAVAKMKITRVRVYSPEPRNPLFNQSDLVVTVETDAGITGIGEGGSPDTLEQCAGRLIGKDPHYIERLWQDMYRAYFYPAGREKMHALGALDLALWDIRGKALNRPVHALLGGMTRNYCECYNTAGTVPGIRPGMGVKERAQLTMAAGYRAFRFGAADTPANTTFNTHEKINQMYEECVQVREGVGKNGDWCIDFHQRFDLSDAIRGIDLIKDLAPYFVEDPVRTEAFGEDLPILRRSAKVPIAAGEEWGNRWDFNKLVESHDLDYVRVTLPNVGGITEMMKILAICETHFVGIIPHFTGPISTAALVNSIGTFSGPVLMEYNYGGRTIPHMPVGLDFKEGKLYASERPGIGVEIDLKPLKQIAEFTQPITNRAQTYFRPDGSITNW